MPIGEAATPLEKKSLPVLAPAVRKLFAFSVVLLAVDMADGIMSYIAPILIEQRFGNAFIMGLIMGTSSAFGLAFDFLAGKWFSKASYLFFTKWLLLFALTFPLILLLLPHELIFFVLAMAVWGIYYEMIKFSQFSFVGRTMTARQHTLSWSFFEVLHAIGFLLGPVLASLLLEYDAIFSLTAAILCYLFAVLSFKLFMVFTKTKTESLLVADTKKSKAAKAEPSVIAVWELLGRKLWPLLLFSFALVLIDTAFLSIGTLLSEDLKQESLLGLLLIPAYTAPFLIVPWFASPISKYLGKKRTAFVAGIIGGTVLAIGSTAIHAEVLIATVFAASFCFALAYPEINATFEDYVVRVHRIGNTLVGLQNSVFSLAYTIGPPFAGFVAMRWGNQHTLTIFGGLLAVVSFIALVVTPRKVHMPQTALSLDTQ